MTVALTMVQKMSDLLDQGDPVGLSALHMIVVNRELITLRLVYGRRLKQME